MNGKIVHRGTLVVFGILLLVCPAWAGEEEDRVRDVEDYLSRVKDRLDGIAGKSSTSDIDSAIESADKVKEYVDKLKSIPAQNEPGKTMVSSYPDYVSKFKESAKSLKAMKEAQLKAAEARLSERCNDAGLALRPLMQSFVDKKDPNGVIKIPEEAEKVGRIYGEELKKMDEVHREMEQWKGYTRNFSESHGKWSEVKSKLQDGTNEIWDRWNHRMGESRSKCQDIAKGKANPAVQEVMAKLQEVMANLFAEAERSAKDLMYYYEDFRKLDLDLTLKLVLAISEADDEAQKDVSERATSDAKAKINTEFDKVVKRKDEALKLLEEVRNKPGFREKFSDVDRLQREVNEKFNQISKMKTNIDPVGAYLSNAGLEMEKSRHGGCDAYGFETGNGKADCARASGCFIIEYKPDTADNIRKGEEQLRKHRRGLLDKDKTDRRNDLNKINSDFAKCQDFHLTIEAYRFSPEIKEDGSVRVPSASWRTYTVNP